MSSAEKPIEKIDFEGWEWGDYDDPDLSAFWRRANENGAQTAMEQLTNDQAVCIVGSDEAGAMTVRVHWGPFIFEFRPTKDDDAHPDDGAIDIANVEIDSNWSG